MIHGFIKLAAALPEIRIGDVRRNLDSCINEARALASDGARIAVFPELSLTGASCGDLFLSRTLLRAAEDAVGEFIKNTADLDSLFVIGVPIARGASVYSCAVAVKGGRMLAVVPLRALSGSLRSEDGEISFAGFTAPFSSNAVLASDLPEELRAVIVPSDFEESFALNSDATVVLIPAAEPEGVGASEKRAALVSAMAEKLGAAVVYANAGTGESTSECVFSGHSVIADGEGNVSCRAPFSCDALTMTVDTEALAYRRRRAGTRLGNCNAITVSFSFDSTKSELPTYSTHPFIPSGDAERQKACKRAFEIQAQGLAARFERSYSRSMVVGISGGLDSTLAILVMARAADILKAKGKDVSRDAIHAITMPCFGTTERTKSNAEHLSELLGASVRCIDIKAAVTQHFLDIGHAADDYSVVYENAQARERTQVLMDIANAEGGLVVGTGDLSEAALGWATYNGDHMSMYGVNASVPKTLVRAIVQSYADECGDVRVASVLYDILATPVSPELLPPKDGQIAQCTEGIVGPYELHDFFIYHFVKNGASPDKLLRIAESAFDGIYSAEVVRGWCEVFLKRFISQQFKRSCTPDAPSVGIVSLSPRGAWRMPSDLSGAAFTLGRNK